MSMSSPAIGQRWLSDAETELGLGMVVEVNPRTITILFPKSEETRVYAKQNAPLSRIRFNIGDTIKDTDTCSIGWYHSDIVRIEHEILAKTCKREIDLFFL